MPTSAQPTVRRLTKRRLERIAAMELQYSLSDPLRPDRFGAKMPDEESWYVVLADDEDNRVACGGIHRVPICNSRDLAWETDNGDDIPGHPVSVVVDFDTPTAGVLRRIGKSETAPGQSFLVIENVVMSKPWGGLGLDTLFLATALRKLYTVDDLFAVAEPVPWHVKGSRPRADMALKTKPLFTQLGFKPYRDGVWLLGDWWCVWDALTQLQARFLIEHV